MNKKYIYTEHDEERAKDIIMFMAFLQDLIHVKGRREEIKSYLAAGTAAGREIEDIEKELGIGIETANVVSDSYEVTQDMIQDEVSKSIKNRFSHWYPGDSFVEAVKEVSVGLEKLVSEMKNGIGGGLDEESYNKLIHKIYRGEYFYAVYKDDEYKQFRKKDLELDIIINKQCLYNIAEYAMACSCNKCTKLSKKKCNLRMDFLNAGVPTQDYDIDDLIQIRARAKELELQALGKTEEEVESTKRQRTGIKYNTSCEYYYDEDGNKTSDRQRKDRIKLLKDNKKAVEIELESLKNGCSHSDITVTKYDSAYCNICDTDLGWHCSASPTKACMYRCNEEGLDINYYELTDNELYLLCKERNIDCGSEPGRENREELVELLENYEYEANNDECCIYCHKPEERK